MPARVRRCAKAAVSIALCWMSTSNASRSANGMASISGCCSCAVSALAMAPRRRSCSFSMVGCVHLVSLLLDRWRRSSMVVAGAANVAVMADAILGHGVDEWPPALEQVLDKA